MSADQCRLLASAAASARPLWGHFAPPAATYTIVESAKLIGLDPEANLAAVLDRWHAVIPSTG